MPPCSSDPASSTARPGRSSCPRRAAGRAWRSGRSAHRKTRATGRRPVRRSPAFRTRARAASPGAGGRWRQSCRRTSPQACAACRGTIARHSGRACPGRRGTMLRWRSSAGVGAGTSGVRRRRAPVGKRARVFAVAGEQFVAAFAGQHDLDVFARQRARRNRAERSMGARSARLRARSAGAARRRNPDRR